MPTTVDRSDEDTGLYDPLTGLPGRLLQRANLVQALRRADRHRSQVAVLFLDVEDFGDVNERIGRELADEVLILLAGRIQSSLRGTDMTARLDGDEFVVVCEDLSEPQDLDMIRRRIVDAISAPIRVGTEVIELRVTSGTAMSKGVARAGDLLSRANEEMLATRKARPRN